MKLIGFKVVAIAIIVTASSCLAIAQGATPSEEPPASAKSMAYHALRLRENKPTYHLAEISGLIAKLKNNHSDDNSLSAISDKAFGRLNLRARFTYCMIHGETWSQNCNGMPALVSEENLIYGQPSGAFGEEDDWSDRQRAFLHSHRSAVTTFIRATMHESKFVGTNLKKAILEIDDNDLIPDLITAYKGSHKDLDILSTLSLLMKHGQFKPYVHSPIYKALYGPSASYQTSVPFSADHVNFIITSAEAFYKSKKV